MPGHPQTHELLAIALKAFGTARLIEMYRRWLSTGTAYLKAHPPSPRRLNDDRGRIESLGLLHSFRHLISLVSERPAPPQPDEKGDEGGEHTSARP